jgi:hypothetical protein
MALALEMTMNGGIYHDLAAHQRVEDWFGRDLVTALQEWSDRFIVEFELDIPQVVLRVDVLPRSCLGHFRPGHNGFGLKGEIALNHLYVKALPKWRVLGVLLHELLHAWQHVHGLPSKGNHHNGEFRRKADSLGLIVGRRGITGFFAASRFKDLLRSMGIDAPSDEIPPRDQRSKGNSKSKKWVCGCGTSIRCAVPDLAAQCLKCVQVFRRCD